MNIFAGLVLALLPAWQSTGPWGGSATAIAVDPSNPSTLLAGARNSLVYRSTDSGNSWTRLPFPRHFSGAVTTVAIHPANPALYLAGIELPQSPFAGLWYSLDAGATWQMSRGLEGISVQALSFFKADPRRLAAATRNGVWLSTDSGLTFSRISLPYNHELRSVTAVAIHPTNPAIIYAGTTHLPWKTTDGGQNWASIHEGMIDDSDVFSIHIDPAAPDRILASACSGIYSSPSAGAAWAKVRGIPAEQRRTHVVALEPGSSSTIYAGTTLGLLKSTNSGATFRRLNRLHILSLAFDPRNPRRLYLATEGAGLLVSHDAGETLTPINNGFVNRRVLALASAASTLYANIVQDGEAGGIFASSDSGASWMLASSSALLRDNHVSLLAGCPHSASFLFAGNHTRALRTLDAGKSWRDAPLPAGHRLQALACTLAASKPLLLAGTNRGLLRSSDLGATWQPARLTSASIAHDVQAIYTSTADPRRLLLRTAHAIYLSDDAAASWRALNILFPVSRVNDIALAAGAFLVATPDGLYLSSDAGRTWSRRLNGLQPGTVSSLAVRPTHENEVVAAQFGRLYLSSNSGLDWLELPGSQLLEASLRALFFHSPDPRILALTPDIGVFRFEIPPFQGHNNTR